VLPAGLKRKPPNACGYHHRQSTWYWKCWLCSSPHILTNNVEKQARNCLFSRKYWGGQVWNLQGYYPLFLFGFFLVLIILQYQQKTQKNHVLNRNCNKMLLRRHCGIRYSMFFAFFSNYRLVENNVTVLLVESPLEANPVTAKI